MPDEILNNKPAQGTSTENNVLNSPLPSVRPTDPVLPPSPAGSVTAPGDANLLNQEQINEQRAVDFIQAAFGFEITSTMSNADLARIFKAKMAEFAKQSANQRRRTSSAKREKYEKLREKLKRYDQRIKDKEVDSQSDPLVPTDPSTAVTPPTLPDPTIDAVPDGSSLNQPSPSAQSTVAHSAAPLAPPNSQVYLPTPETQRPLSDLSQRITQMNTAPLNPPPTLPPLTLNGTIQPQQLNPPQNNGATPMSRVTTNPQTLMTPTIGHVPQQAPDANFPRPHQPNDAHTLTPPSQPSPYGDPHESQKRVGFHLHFGLPPQNVQSIALTGDTFHGLECSDAMRWESELHSLSTTPPKTTTDHEPLPISSPSQSSLNFRLWRGSKQLFNADESIFIDGIKFVPTLPYRPTSHGRGRRE